MKFRNSVIHNYKSKVFIEKKRSFKKIKEKKADDEETKFEEPNIFTSEKSDYFSNFQEKFSDYFSSL